MENHSHDSSGTQSVSEEEILVYEHDENPSYLLKDKVGLGFLS